MDAVAGSGRKERNLRVSTRSSPGVENELVTAGRMRNGKTFLKPCEPLSAFRFFFFFFFGASAWHRKPPQVYSSVVYTLPRHAKTSSRSHPQKTKPWPPTQQRFSLHPTSQKLATVASHMASRAREGCQLVRQTVLFLNLLQKMGTLGTFLVASRKHRPHHSSIHVYTPRPDYLLSQRPLLIHTTHKNKALASDTTKP